MNILFKVIINSLTKALIKKKNTKKKQKQNKKTHVPKELKS